MSDERQVDIVDDFLTAYEHALGVTPGFLLALLHEGDDWSFTIKLHAVLESAISGKLTEVVAKPELDRHFRRIQMWSKVKTAADLRLLTDQPATFVKALSELRNGLVHRVRNTGFTFDAWAADPASTNPKPERLVGKPLNSLTPSPLADVRPIRFAVWINAIRVLVDLHLGGLRDQQEQDRRIEAEIEKRQRLGGVALREALLRQLGSSPADPPS